MTIAPSTWYGPRSVAQAANSALGGSGVPRARPGTPGLGPMSHTSVEVVARALQPDVAHQR